MLSSAVFFKVILYSPRLFCLSMIPLSTEFIRTGSGNKIRNDSTNCLFYMDNLKLFAKDDDNL